MPTHYVVRELIALGHDVKQVPPAYARPFRQGHKNDFRDAQAITEAQRPLPKQRADDQRRHCAGHSRSAAQLSIVPFEANGVEFCADAEEVLAKLPAGYQWSFASLETGTPSRSRSAACNTSFSACVKPPAR